MRRRIRGAAPGAGTALISAAVLMGCGGGGRPIPAACEGGVADGRVGERLEAIGVLEQHARGVSGAELRAFLMDRPAPCKIPRHIEFRDMLPKSKVGKLLRREIRDEKRRKPGRG